MAWIESILTVLGVFLVLNSNVLFDDPDSDFHKTFNEIDQTKEREYANFEMITVMIDEIEESTLSIRVQDDTNRGTISYEEDLIRIGGYNSIRLTGEVIDLNRDLIIENCGNISFDNVKFEMDEGGMNHLKIEGSENVIISDSDFKNIELNVEGNDIRIDNCRVSMGRLNITNQWGSSDLVNSSFWDSEVNISGVEYFIIRNNSFKRSDLLVFLHPAGVNISENRFFEGESCLFLMFSYSDVISSIWSNEFESCKGIDMGEKYSWPLGNWRCYNWNISRNSFKNCSHSINWPFGYGFGVRIWLNMFYHNKGTGDNGSESQVTHSIRSPVFYDVQWYLNGVGNYWQNHRTPDNDGNNIVDIPYDIATGVQDLYPLAHPCYDNSKPFLRIDSPLPGKHNRSYFQVRWTATDRVSGIDSVQMSIDKGDFFEITGEDWIPVNLDLGTHEIRLKAVDRIGLFNITSVEIEVLDIDHPVGIIYPRNGDLITGDPIRMVWRIEDYFPLKNKTVVMDGEVQDFSDDVFEMKRSLAEGNHTISITTVDERNCTIQRSVGFFVDLNPPDVEILSPPDGSILSNHQVRFQWTADDLFSLKELKYRIDDGVWISSDSMCDGSFDMLLKTGKHTFEIEAVDRVGHSKTCSSAFSILERSGLVFTSPVNGYITRSEIVDLNWEYTGQLLIISGEMGIRSSAERINVTGLSNYEVSLPTEGEYDFLLRLYDISGNYVEANITIIRDLTPPIISIDVPEYSNSSDVEVSWIAKDDIGIKRFDFKIDGSEWFETPARSSIMFKSISEGEHTIDIKAVDHAGNEAVDEGAFIVDRTKPELDVISPVPDQIFDRIGITVVWTVYDSVGIEGVHLNLSGKDRRFDDSGSWDTYGDVGNNLLEIIVRDFAGNTVIKMIPFNIDISKPFIKWLTVPDEYCNVNPISLSWVYSDDLGISEVIMEVNGEPSFFKNEVYSTLLDLEDGNHSISITVIDHANRQSSISATFILDTTGPSVTLRDDPMSNPRSVSWTVVDNTSGVDNISIYIDDFLVRIADGNGSLQIDSLSPGVHTISASAFDLVGNEASEEITLTIEKKGGSEEKGSWIIIIIILILALLIIYVCMLLFFYISRSGKTTDVADGDWSEPKSSELVSEPKDLLMLPGSESRTRMVSAPPVRESLPVATQRICSDQMRNYPKQYDLTPDPGNLRDRGK